MKKKILTVALVLSSVCAVAQQKENRDTDGSILRGPYETNSFWSNWYIGVGGGINIYEGELDNKTSVGNRIAPALDVSLGKWITPSYGVRLQYSGLKAKGLTDASGMYAKGAHRGYYKEEFNVSNLHADFMWNWSNGFLGFNEKRVWNVIPFVGFGWARSWGNSTHDNEIAANIGILNTFRLGKRLDLTLEGRQMLVKECFDGTVSGSKGEGMSSVTLGLSVKLGKTRFNRVEKVAPADYSSYNERINALRAKNHDLSTEAQRLAAELEVARNRKPEVVNESKVTASPVALFFNIGKATLDKKELTNLEFYVNNAIKADKNKTFTLIGSADSATGSKELNQRLSEQRMEYVYNLLVEKYKISPERLVKKAEGDTNNRFSEPELNRAVIVE